MSEHTGLISSYQLLISAVCTNTAFLHFDESVPCCGYSIIFCGFMLWRVHNSWDVLCVAYIAMMPTGCTCVWFCMLLNQIASFSSTYVITGLFKYETFPQFRRCIRFCYLCHWGLLRESKVHHWILIYLSMTQIRLSLGGMWLYYFGCVKHFYIGGTEQDCIISKVILMETMQFYTKPFVWKHDLTLLSGMMLY